jgi:hypothetical protein
MYYQTKSGRRRRGLTYCFQCKRAKGKRRQDGKGARGALSRLPLYYLINVGISISNVSDGNLIGHFGGYIIHHLLLPPPFFLLLRMLCVTPVLFILCVKVDDTMCNTYLDLLSWLTVASLHPMSQMEEFMAV